MKLDFQTLQSFIGKALFGLLTFAALNIWSDFNEVKEMLQQILVKEAYNTSRVDALAKELDAHNSSSDKRFYVLEQDVRNLYKSTK